jgi:hypothetical protein
MGKIEFTMENMEKCLCACPVQADSACSKEKLIKMQKLMQKRRRQYLLWFPECTAHQANLMHRFKI